MNIFNNKKVINIRHITLEEAIIPCLSAVRIGHCFPTFRREPAVFTFKVTKQSRSQNFEVEGGRLFRNVGKQPNPRRNKLLPRYAHGFAANNIFQRCVIDSG